MSEEKRKRKKRSFTVKEKCKKGVGERIEYRLATPFVLHTRSLNFTDLWKRLAEDGNPRGVDGLKLEEAFGVVRRPAHQPHHLSLVAYVWMKEEKKRRIE